MENLSALSCKDFSVELASAAPTPGGGGAAAMAGALGAALSAMVANLTIGKEKFAAQEQEVKALLVETEKVRVELLALIEADAAVFGKFMSCYKLPKNTEEEKQLRANAIRQAAKDAGEVPLKIGRASVKVLELADRLVEIGNPGVITDGACSALLARAAFRCAVYNVVINLGLTKDDAYNKNVKAELDQLEEKALKLENKVLCKTNQVLG